MRGRATAINNNCAGNNADAHPFALIGAWRCHDEPLKESSGQASDANFAKAPALTGVRRAVRRRFARGVHMPDAAVAEYLSGGLSDFTHVDNVYRIRNAHGLRIEHVADMLAESNLLVETSSFDEVQGGSYRQLLRALGSIRGDAGDSGSTIVRGHSVPTATLTKTPFLC